jgi:phosphate starvation-inducible protein PhoH
MSSSADAASIAASAASRPSHDITFGIGPAGTGKTYLAVACAVDAFERELVSASC